MLDARCDWKNHRAGHSYQVSGWTLRPSASGIAKQDVVRPRAAEPGKVMVFRMPRRYRQTKRMQRRTTNGQER